MKRPLLILSIVSTLAFMLASTSCTTAQQQAALNTGLTIAERRGAVKAQDVDDAKLLGSVLFPADTTASK